VKGDLNKLRSLIVALAVSLLAAPAVSQNPSSPTVGSGTVTAGPEYQPYVESDQSTAPQPPLYMGKSWESPVLISIRTETAMLEVRDHGKLLLQVDSRGRVLYHRGRFDRTSRLFWQSLAAAYPSVCQAK